MKPAVALLRVSRKRQKKSGLGLEAQERDIKFFAEHNDFTIIAKFVEVKSGAAANRVIASEAIAMCRRKKATLLVDTMDRLTRDVLFLALLVHSGVPFICVNRPGASKAMNYIEAVLAEDEHDKISARTKAALQSAKLRGTELGSFGKNVLSKRNHKASIAFAHKMRPIILAIIRDGFSTLKSISNELNRRQLPTFRGGTCRWHPATVHKVIHLMNQKRT